MKSLLTIAGTHHQRQTKMHPDNIGIKNF